MIENLARVVPEADGRPDLAGPDHPIRKVTREIAFEPGGWTPERASNVGALFDKLAPEWHTRESPDRKEPLLDALDRGASIEPGLCLEIGSGTGFSTPDLLARFGSVMALDLSIEMLRRAPPDVGDRVRADAAHLPVASGAAKAVVLVNAFLFPAELDRVLSADGVLIWVSSLGDRTPIYLSAPDVEKALPGAWSGRAADAGWGSWCVLSRGAAS